MVPHGGTGGQTAPTAKLSRRALFCCTAVLAPVPRLPSSAESETIGRCQNWLRLNAEIERLHVRYGDLESWLCDHHGWFELTPEEQQALPAALEFHAADAALNRLPERRNDLANALAGLKGTGLSAIIHQLTVVEQMIWPEDHPDVHPAASALVSSALNALRTLSSRGGGAP